MIRGPARRLGVAALVAVLAAPAIAHAGGPPAARAGAPPPLSREHRAVAISSPFGSGSFGRWIVDSFGLPAYRYTLAEQTAVRARQPELNGRTDAWHQVGNDHIVADAFNHGYVQLWSQDRRYQWTNLYQPASDHFAGGYGYLRVAGHTISTLYDDRPAGAAAARNFGVGYLHRRTIAAGVSVNEFVYAPFGDDPLLLHDVTIANRTTRTKRLSWFEYWDVNPYAQATKTNIGLAAPTYDARRRTLSVAQLPGDGDARPLSIFAAALKGPVAGYETSARAFFGGGARALPAEVGGDRLSDARAGPVAPGAPGATMFAFRAPLTLAAHRSVTLRYAYGSAHAGAIGALVARYARRPSPLRRSERAWARWLPRVAFGRRRPWLSRELAWDAYTLRSGATHEDCAGRHIVSQGGYYQYSGATQSAYRDPLQHILPLVYADPALARDVLIYSAQEQPRGDGVLPYQLAQLCRPDNVGASDDLDLWLLLAASEYGLASRDFSFFAQRVRYTDGGRGSLWDHLKLAYRHQESLRAAHGGYLALALGDWSDLSSQFLGMTESTLVTAQLAYVYRHLAELADARGDKRFAARLRSSAARDLAVTRAQWTGRWYSRGFSGDSQLGATIIFGEPQPWAILAGAPSRSQATTLVHGIRRFLTGIGAPPQLHGPSRIGSSQSPASDDPGLPAHTPPALSVGSDNAVFVGGTWYAINGWLVWALAQLDGRVGHASAYAFDEFLRNTLAAHAAAYPDHWDGVISVDDVCHSFYSATPSKCGTGLDSNYAGQIMHQPAWSLFDALKLAGIEPTAAGYQIRPHLPMSSFSLRYPNIGVAYDAARARGYVTAQRAGTLTVAVAPPRQAPRYVVYADGRRVAYRRRHGLVEFRLRTRAGRAADWALVMPGAMSAGASADGTSARGGGLAASPRASAP